MLPLYNIVGLCIILIILLNFQPSVNCFDPLIQLPTSGHVQKSPIKSTVEFNVDDYGAKGNEITDDTKGGSGYAKKITFQNIRMENVSNPIIIDQYYCDSPVPCPNQTLAVTIKSISFIDIKGTSASGEAMKFAWSDGFPCKKLHLGDIQLISYYENVTTSFCWQACGSTWSNFPTSLFLKL